MKTWNSDADRWCNFVFYNTILYITLVASRQSPTWGHVRLFSFLLHILLVDLCSQRCYYCSSHRNIWRRWWWWLQASCLCTCAAWDKGQSSENNDRQVEKAWHDIRIVIDVLPYLHLQAILLPFTFRGWEKLSHNGLFPVVSLPLNVKMPGNPVLLSDQSLISRMMSSQDNQHFLWTCWSS